MTNRQTLPGVTRLALVRAAHLSPHLAERLRAGMPAAVTAERREIPFTGIPELSLERTYDNGGWIETAKLSFLTAESLPDYEPLALLITAADGATYLMGSRERPHPVLKQRGASGRPDGDPAAVSVEIVLKAPAALVKIT